MNSSRYDEAAMDILIDGWMCSNLLRDWNHTIDVMITSSCKEWNQDQSLM